MTQLLETRLDGSEEKMTKPTRNRKIHVTAFYAAAAVLGIAITIALQSSPAPSSPPRTADFSVTTTPVIPQPAVTAPPARVTPAAPTHAALAPAAVLAPAQTQRAAAVAATPADTTTEALPPTPALATTQPPAVCVYECTPTQP